MGSVVAEFKALRLRLGLSQKAAVAELRGLREVAEVAGLQTVDLAKFELRHSEATVKRFLPVARAWIQAKKKDEVVEGGDCEVVEVQKRSVSKESTTKVVVVEETAIVMKDVRKVLVKEEVKEVEKEAFQEALGKVKGEAAAEGSALGRKLPVVRLRKIALPQAGEPAPYTGGTSGQVEGGTPGATPFLAPGAPAPSLLAPGAPAPVRVKQEPVLVALEGRKGVEQGVEPECIDLEEEEEKEYRSVHDYCCSPVLLTPHPWHLVPQP